MQNHLCYLFAILLQPGGVCVKYEALRHSLCLIDNGPLSPQPGTPLGPRGDAAGVSIIASSGVCARRPLT